jgi:hypothetical protein
MAGRGEGGESPSVRVALVADPGLAVEIARRIATVLPEKLSSRLPGTDWDIDVVCEGVVADEQVSVGRVLHATGELPTAQPSFPGLV